MGTIPYVRPPYESNASTARMSDLIRARGTVAANAERQQGAANAYLWGNLINTAGRTMSDLIDYKAGESRRKLDDARASREMKTLDKANLLDTLAVTTRGLPLDAKAKVYADHGFEAEASAYQKAAQSEADRSNKQQVGALIGVYGQDQPDEVMRQGMAIEPEMTGKYVKDRQDHEDKVLDRAYKQVTALPAIKKAGVTVLSTPITDQVDLDARLSTLRPYAEMGGLQDVLAEAFTPTFDPARTEAERVRVLTMLEEKLKPEINKFAVFHAGWVAEKGEPRTAKDSADLIRAFEATQPKTGAEGEKPISQAQVGTAERAKDAALRRVETQWRKDYENEYVPGQNMPSEAALADLEQRKLEVENSFRRQVSRDPVSDVAEAGYRPAVKDADKWRIAADAALEKAFQASGDMSDQANADLQAKKAEIAAEYRRRLAAEIRSGGGTTMSALAAPFSAPAAPVAAPATATPPAPSAANSPGSAPPRYGPAMTPAKATEILSAKLNRAPTPVEIQKFMAKYPYERIQ